MDANGKLIDVQYQADDQGFRILGANNLPVAPEATLEPVQDTPEVRKKFNFFKVPHTYTCIRLNKQLIICELMVLNE